MSSLYDLLKQMVESGASDLHITTGSPPRVRVNGKIHRTDETIKLERYKKHDIEVVIDRSILTSDLKYEFYLQWGMDYSENNFYNIQITD